VHIEFYTEGCLSKWSHRWWWWWCVKHIN